MWSVNDYGVKYGDNYVIVHKTPYYDDDPELQYELVTSLDGKYAAVFEKLGGTADFFRVDDGKAVYAYTLKRLAYHVDWPAKGYENQPLFVKFVGKHVIFSYAIYGLAYYDADTGVKMFECDTFDVLLEHRVLHDEYIITKSSNIYFHFTRTYLWHIPSFLKQHDDKDNVYLKELTVDYDNIVDLGDGHVKLLPDEQIVSLQELK